MPKQTQPTERTEITSVSIKEKMEQYVALMMSGKKKPASMLLKDTLDNLKPKQSLDLMNELNLAIKNYAGAYEILDRKPGEQDYELIGQKIIDYLENAEYKIKIAIMDKIMASGQLPPKNLAMHLLDSTRKRVDKFDKDELMHALLFRAYIGLGIEDGFLGNWEDRYQALYDENSDQFSLRDIADLIYCCAEMRLELREDFIVSLCDRLKLKTVMSDEIVHEDAVRALHALAMLDCSVAGQTKRIKDTAGLVAEKIQSPANLSADQQRALICAAIWFDFDIDCPVPESRQPGPKSADLRTKFEVFSTLQPNYKSPSPPKNYKPRMKTLTLGGEKVDIEISVPVEPPCIIEQDNNALSSRLGFTAAVTTKIEQDIHIIADEKTDLRYFLTHVGNWGIDDKWSLKGRVFLKSQVIAKLTGSPVLHIRGEEIARLSKGDHTKMADAFGTLTWPVLRDDMTGGVFHAVQRGKDNRGNSVMHYNLA